MSLLLLFGGVGGPITQAGYYSPVAFWMGGAGSVTAGGSFQIAWMRSRNIIIKAGSR